MSSVNGSEKAARSHQARSRRDVDETGSNVSGESFTSRDKSKAQPPRSAKTRKSGQPSVRDNRSDNGSVGRQSIASSNRSSMSFRSKALGMISGFLGPSASDYARAGRSGRAGTGEKVFKTMTAGTGVAVGLGGMVVAGAATLVMPHLAPFTLTAGLLSAGLAAVSAYKGVKHLWKNRSGRMKDRIIGFAGRLLGKFAPDDGSQTTPSRSRRRSGGSHDLTVENLDAHTNSEAGSIVGGSVNGRRALDDTASTSPSRKSKSRKDREVKLDLGSGGVVAPAETPVSTRTKDDDALSDDADDNVLTPGTGRRTSRRRNATVAGAKDVEAHDDAGSDRSATETWLYDRLDLDKETEAKAKAAARQYDESRYRGSATNAARPSMSDPLIDPSIPGLRSETLRPYYKKREEDGDSVSSGHSEKLYRRHQIPSMLSPRSDGAPPLMGSYAEGFGNDSSRPSASYVRHYRDDDEESEPSFNPSRRDRTFDDESLNGADIYSSRIGARSRLGNERRRLFDEETDSVDRPRERLIKTYDDEAETGSNSSEGSLGKDRFGITQVPPYISSRESGLYDEHEDSLSPRIQTPASRSQDKLETRSNGSSRTVIQNKPEKIGASIPIAVAPVATPSLFGAPTSKTRKPKAVTIENAPEDDA